MGWLAGASPHCAMLRRQCLCASKQTPSLSEGILGGDSYRRAVGIKSLLASVVHLGDQCEKSRD